MQFIMEAKCIHESVCTVYLHQNQKKAFLSEWQQRHPADLKKLRVDNKRTYTKIECYKLIHGLL